MEYGTFVFYNVFGGIFWVLAMSLLGYFLGSVIPDVDHYVLPIVGAIILLSVIPAVIGITRRKPRA